MIYDVDIDNDSFDLNDNFPIEPEKDKNMSLPFDSYNLEFVFGKDYLYKYKNFLEDYDFIFQISNQLTTTLYTLDYEDIQNIMDALKSEIIIPPVISNKLYNFVTNNINKIMGYRNYPNLYNAIYELFLKETGDGTDFQTNFNFEIYYA